MQRYFHTQGRIFHYLTDAKNMEFPVFPHLISPSSPNFYLTPPQPGKSSFSLIHPIIIPLHISQHKINPNLCKSSHLQNPLKSNYSPITTIQALQTLQTLQPSNLPALQPLQPLKPSRKSKPSSIPTISKP